jgi:hypothetical protein
MPLLAVVNCSLPRPWKWCSCAQFGVLKISECVAPLGSSNPALAAYWPSMPLFHQQPQAWDMGGGREGLWRIGEQIAIVLAYID